MSFLSDERQHFFDFYQWGLDPKEIMEISFDAGAKITKEAILAILKEINPCCGGCSSAYYYDQMVQKIEELK